MCKGGEKKGLFSKIFGKMDAKMKEKADQQSCSTTSSCCSTPKKVEVKKDKNEGCGCC